MKRTNTVSFKAMKMEKVYAKYGEVEVYNVDDEMSKELIEVLQDNLNEDGTVKEFDTLYYARKILPIFANFDFDGVSDEEIIEIANKPNEILDSVFEDINYLMNKFSEKLKKNVDALNTMSEEDRNKLLGIDPEKAKRLERLKAIEAEKKALMAEDDNVVDVDFAGDDE